MQQLSVLLLRFGFALLLAGELPAVAASSLGPADTAATNRQIRHLLREGHRAMQRGDYPAATTFGQRALRFSQQVPGQRRGEAEAMMLLAEVDFFHDDMPSAVRWMRQAVRTAASTGELPLQIRAYDLLGNCLSENAEYREADRWLRRAREGRRQLSDRSGETLTLVNLAANELYQEHLPAARAFIEEAVRVAQQQPDVTMVANALSNRARIRTQQGEHAAAVADVEEALRLTEKAGYLDHIQPVLNSMSELYERAGRLREALASERRASHLRDSLNSREVSRQLAELNTRFRVEQQQTRIRALTQQRRIADLQVQQAQTRARLWNTAAVLLAALLAVGAWLYRQLRRQRAQLAASEAALRQANQTKDQLMSIIGHDLRSPVAGFQQVGMVLRAMAKAPNPAELQALAAELDTSSTEMSALLDNLLHWGRAQTGQARAFPEVTDLGAVLLSVEKLLGPVAQKKGVALRTVAPAGLPAASTDAALLAVVLRNLVSNAVKFTPAGGTVTITAEPTANHLTLAVRDTGVGLTPERLEQFLNASGALASTPGTAGEAGTGLGLAVVRHFVGLLGSTLQLQSVPGTGTTATFTLPVAAAEARSHN